MKACIVTFLGIPVANEDHCWSKYNFLESVCSIVTFLWIPVASASEDHIVWIWGDFLKACKFTFLWIPVASDDHVVGIRIVFLKAFTLMLPFFGHQ